jgi:serine/threonine protein kinase
MLSGDYPFDGDTVAEINEKIRMGRFETPKNISENAADLLDRMIEYRNDMRASFAQLLDHPWFIKPPTKKIDTGVVDRLKKYKSESFLKNTVMQLLVKQLSSSETANLKE